MQPIPIIAESVEVRSASEIATGKSRIIIMFHDNEGQEHRAMFVCYDIYVESILKSLNRMKSVPIPALDVGPAEAVCA